MVVVTVTVSTGAPAPDVAAGDVVAAEEDTAVEDDAAAGEEAAAVELEEPLTSLPPIMLAFWLAAPALLFK